MSIHEKVKLWEQLEGINLFVDLGLTDHANILDYGCGFGHYTFAASRFLGCKEGTVYAIDTNNDCLKHVSKIAQDEGLTNIRTVAGNGDYRLDFSECFFDMIMYYDILHGEGFHRFTLFEEANRTLKMGGIMSILPFHLTNFRDKEGKKKTYTYLKLIAEAKEYGFSQIDEMPTGVHFEKYHS